jgi:hypothetical protein
MMYDQWRSPSGLISSYDRKNGRHSNLFWEMFSCLSACGVSPAVVWLQLCAFVSLLGQGVADVLWPNGQRAPLGVSAVLVGPSGCGKSVIYNLLMEPIEDYTSHSAAGDPLTNLLIEDATLPAVIAHLKTSPYAAIFTDEAGALVHLQGAAPTLAKLIDGTPLRRSRASSDPVHLMGHRFMMLQLLQPRAFDTSRLLNSPPGGVGLINRFMAAVATPTLGSLHQLSLREPLALRYRARAHELLNATLQNAHAKPMQLPALRLSRDARGFFEHVADESRHQAIAPGSPLVPHAEYVTRHGERILRLAGAVHLFNHGIEGLEGEMSLETMQLADQVGFWSVQGFQQLAYKPTQVQRDAQTIEQALRSTGNGYFALSALRRYAANLGLTRRRIDEALPELIAARRGQIVSHGKVDYLQLFAGPYYEPRYIG